MSTVDALKVTESQGSWSWTQDSRVLLMDPHKHYCFHLQKTFPCGTALGGAQVSARGFSTEQGVLKHSVPLAKSRRCGWGSHLILVLNAWQKTLKC